MKMLIFLTLLALGFEATVQADGDDAGHAIDHYRQGQVRR